MKFLGTKGVKKICQLLRTTYFVKYYITTVFDLNVNEIRSVEFDVNVDGYIPVGIITFALGDPEITCNFFWVYEDKKTALFRLINKSNLIISKSFLEFKVLYFKS